MPGIASTASDTYDIPLTDPISLELFEDPVQTPCCGNTLSRASLKKALPRCPLCRADVGEAHPSFDVDSVPINRAVAHLVEAHRAAHGCCGGAAAGATASVPDVSDKSGKTPPPVKLHTCAECGKTNAHYRCSRCKTVHYCSTACQHSAWPGHKRDCCKPTRREKAEAAAQERAQTRAVVGGGLAALRESMLAAADQTPDALDDNGGAEGTSGGGGGVLRAILEGMASERLVAFSDSPRYDRLLIASRGGKDTKHVPFAYQEHVVEAVITTDGGGKGAPKSVEGGVTAPTDGDERGGGACRCAWVMMDYQLDDIRAQWLAPLDAPTLRTHFAAVLARVDACRAVGTADTYTFLADPNIAEADESDAGTLVQQLLADSSLRFLLPSAGIAKLETKKPPDPKDVRKALDMLGNVSLARRPS